MCAETTKSVKPRGVTRARRDRRALLGSLEVFPQLVDLLRVARRVAEARVEVRARGGSIGVPEIRAFLRLLELQERVVRAHVSVHRELERILRLRANRRELDDDAQGVLQSGRAHVSTPV